MRNATIVAVNVCVLCPYCGEPQPAPDNGSDLWLTEQFKATDPAPRACVSCDKRFRVMVVTRATLT